MNTSSRLSAPTFRARRGSAFLVVLVLVFIAAGLVLSYLTLGTEDARITRRAQDYQQGRLLADAGLAYATAKLQHHLNGYRFTMTDAELRNQFNNELRPPRIFPGESDFVFTSPAGTTTVKLNVSTPITYGIIPGGTFFGYEGKYQQYEILIGVRNVRTGTAVAIRKTVQISSAHLVNFGMFFEGDLEIIPSSSMTFSGGVHSNSDLYLGGSLTLLDRVTSYQDIYHRKKFNGSVVGNAGIKNNAGVTKPMIEGGVVYDSDNPYWVDLAIARWDGRVRSFSHGVGYVKPLIAAMAGPRDVIEIPTLVTATNYNAEVESDKFSVKAGLKITVNAATGAVDFRDFHGSSKNSLFGKAVVRQSNGLDVKDTTGQYTLDTAGAYGDPKVIYDPRERKNVTVFDLYVGDLINSFGALFSGNQYTVSEGRGLVFVTFANRDPAKSYAVRLRNGRSLNANAGVSFASDLPVYVEGNYNTVSPKVALVAGDSITFLSNAWQDTRGQGSKSDRVAASTTYNLVALGGALATVPNAVENSGVESVLRVAESWNGRTLTFRGSLISLWNSIHFTSDRDLSRYDPPVMDLGYDTQYLTMSPPGLPHGFVYDELGWEEVPYSAQSW